MYADRKDIGTLPPIISAEQCFSQDITPTGLRSVADWHDHAAKTNIGTVDKKRHSFIAVAIHERADELERALNNG